MNQPYRDVDSILTAAGSAWRAAQPAPPEPDLVRLTGGSPPAAELPRMIGRAWRPGRWAPMAAVGAVAAVLAVVVVPLALSRDRPSVNPTATATESHFAYPALPVDQGAGVPVVGTGTLFRDGDGAIRLCASVVATWDLPPSRAECSPVAVPTTGVDAAWLANVTTGGQAYSRRVRVEGTYHNGTLAVSATVDSPAGIPPPTVEPAMPCPAPSEGWRPWSGFASAEDETEPARRLDEFVRQQSDRYTQVWEGHPGANAVGASVPAINVKVVGTTGDPEKARTELTELYPGNLCVHHVLRSNSDLERIAGTLVGATAMPVEAVPLTIENKVRVTVVALDAPTVEVLQRVGEGSLQIEAPLLRGQD